MIIALILSFGGTKKKLKSRVGRPILMPYHPYPYPYPYRRQRSNSELAPEEEESAEDEEKLLLSAIEELDTFGCFPKMLCYLETKSRDQWTSEETAIVDTFSNATNAAFLQALDLGSRARDPVACDLAYPKCALKDTDLRASLQMADGCSSVLGAMP